MLSPTLKFKDATVGLRVQDYWGCSGTIRAIQYLGKNDNPPSNEKGNYFFVEYDEESDNPLRTDGTWNDKRYCECNARCGMMSRSDNFSHEVNPESVKLLREHFGEKVASWHDFELIKFLIARHFKMPNVIEMLEKHLEWREKFRPSADEFFPPSIADDYPCGFSGKADYDGNLIYCERPGNGGKCQGGEFVNRYTLPVIARWHAAGLEMGIQLMRNSNYRNKRLCYIIDFTHIQVLTPPMVRFARTLAHVEQDNYPENLGRVVILNAPTAVRFIWRGIQSFLDSRTTKKVTFCSPNKAFEIMKQWMPEEFIPDIAGGTCDSWRTTHDMRLGSLDLEPPPKSSLSTSEVPLPESISEGSLAASTSEVSPTSLVNEEV